VSRRSTGGGAFFCGRLSVQGSREQADRAKRWGKGKKVRGKRSRADRPFGCDKRGSLEEGGPGEGKKTGAVQNQALLKRFSKER